MIDYREIIRLKSADYSNTSVASSTGSCRSTVSEVWKRAKEHNLSWPLPSTMTNEVLKQVLYPEQQDSSLRMLPDYEHIHAELAKQGVTLKSTKTPQLSIGQTHVSLPKTHKFLQNTHIFLPDRHHKMPKTACYMRLHPLNKTISGSPGLKDVFEVVAFW